MTSQGRALPARSFSFSFNDTATTEIYTLSLHDALPIYVHEKHFVKSALADHFGRQPLDVVCGGDDKYRLLAFGHPGEQRAEHAARKAIVAVACGKPFFDFIEPQDAWSHDFGRLERSAQVAFG